MSTTIRERWESFRDELIPQKASRQQIADMEFAFYAGALTTFEVLVARELRTMTREEAVANIERVEKELMEFVAGIVAREHGARGAA